MADLSLIEREYDHLMNDVVTFDVDQGDLTVSQEIVQHAGGKDKVLVWEFEMLTGHMAKIVADWRVKVQTAGDQTILGIAIQNAATEESRNKLNLPVGVHSNIFIQIGIEIQGDFIRRIVYADDNPTLAGSIKPNTTGATAHVWEGDGTPNNTYVLFFDTTAKFAIVLFGFWGAY